MIGFGAFRKRERKHVRMEKEDFLLRQIDEFKDKAKQLQSLLNTKESRVQQLQKIVAEREGEAGKLEEVLKSRQQEADDVLECVKDQMDDMSQKINEELEALLKQVSEGVGEQMKGQNQKFEDVQNSIIDLKHTFEDGKRSLEDRIHGENVKSYRNIQMIMVELNKKLVSQEQYEKDMGYLKSMVRCITGVSVIGVLAIILLVLVQLGVFV